MPLTILVEDSSMEGHLPLAETPAVLWKKVEAEGESNPRESMDKVINGLNAELPAGPMNFYSRLLKN